MPGVFDFLSDPNNASLLGIMQGLGQASMPSRLPVPLGAVLGSAAAGGLQGAQTAQAMKKAQLENALSQLSLQGWQNYMNPGQGNASPSSQEASPSSPGGNPFSFIGPYGGASTGAPAAGVAPISSAVPGPGVKAPLGMPTQPTAGQPLINLPGLYGQAVRGMFPGGPGMTMFPAISSLMESITKTGGQPVVNADGSLGISELPGDAAMRSNQAYATGMGTSQGELPAELTKIGAQGEQARTTAAFQKGLDVSTNLIDVSDPNTGAPRKMTQAQLIQLATRGATPTASPAAPVPGKIVSIDGTVIPAAPVQPQSNAPGMQTGPSVAQAEALKQGADLTKGWYEGLPNEAEAEQRFMAIADALKRTQSGSFATEKANIKAGLKAAGIDLGDKVFSSTDPAAVQEALHGNVLAAMDTLKSTMGGTGSRMTQMEFAKIQQALSNPDLQPEANLQIIGQALGLIRQKRALVNDWAAGKQLGWSDPQEFQRQWFGQPENGLQNFVNKAQSDIGPLKGMEAAPVPGAQKAPDGNWYLPDPKRPGKYLMVKPTGQQ